MGSNRYTWEIEMVMIKIVDIICCKTLDKWNDQIESENIDEEEGNTI